MRPAHEITAIPVVVPLAVVALALTLWRLRRRGALTPPRAALLAATCAYAAGILANTLFPILVGANRPHQPWEVYLNLTPLSGTEPADMLRNVVVFLPLGVIAPLLFRAHSWLRVLGVGFVLSLSMESLQLLNAVTGHGGHVADVNDLIANTLGALVGYACYRGVVLVPALSRWAAAAAWPAPRQ